jgi:hypothetical protein
VVSSVALEQSLVQSSDATSSCPAGWGIVASCCYISAKYPASKSSKSSMALFPQRVFSMGAGSYCRNTNFYPASPNTTLVLRALANHVPASPRKKNRSVALCSSVNERGLAASFLEKKIESCDRLMMEYIRSWSLALVDDFILSFSIKRIRNAFLFLSICGAHLPPII